MASGLMAPEESVTRRKQQQVAMLAVRYLQERGKLEADWRADVVAIEMGRDGKPARFEHYLNAVEA
jgi:Holliday junction resolvase-like predicted endonuclease